MADESNWRDRYLVLAEQADKQEQRYLEAERELLRLITRLCVASQGLDSMLDPHLKRLRKAAHEGVGGKLLEQASALGDALVQAQDDRVHAGLIEQVLQHSPLDSGHIKQVLKQWRALAEAPSRASDRQLDELAALLFPHQSAADQGGERPSGLLGRLLGRGEGARAPNQSLRELIQHLKWPAAVQHRVVDLQARLGANAPDDAWMDVVREISALAVEAFDQVNRDAVAANEFLEQLSERLLAIDSFVAGEGDRRRAARESGARLGRAVSSEVGGLSANLRSSPNMTGLRTQVLGALDNIQRHVAKHLQEEAQRSLSAEQQAGVLQKQLEQLQRETFDLRRQVAESQQRAMSDALTGLPNRRAYEQRAAQEFARWRRFAEPLALVVWDVDNFKQINDVFGHKAGDRALALIARILREGMRETDFIARYGGEEFVMLLTGAEQEDALRVSDMLRDRVANAGMHSHNKPVEITLSGGLAMLGEGDDTDRLFERADKALYQAKQSGKNRVVSAPAV